MAAKVAIFFVRIFRVRSASALSVTDRFYCLIILNHLPFLKKITILAT